MAVTRRNFGKTIGAGALGASAAPFVEGQSKAQPNHYQFPQGFQWGCATAAYQVEGGAKEGGRGPSIWDTFSHTPGKVYKNQTGDVADDHYHRYKEDIGLLKSLGATCYRFSISWPRIFPTGTGAPNQAGLDYYSRVLDELHAQGIEPYCTLFHWDLPQALQDRFGGWLSRDTSKAFADYAGYVTGKLSDRISNFFTINEFSSFIDMGYRDGTFAPGLKLPPAKVNQARHCAVLAHGMAVQAIRAKAKAGTKVGLAENLVSGTPVIETEAHIKASEKATRLLNAQYLTAILEGRYMDEYLKRAGADAPKFTPDEMKIIGSPIDILGINIYNPTYVRADKSEAGFAVVKPPSSYPHMASPWLNIGPEGLYWAARHVWEIWKVKEVYVTENGCSSADEMSPDGHIYDTDRVMFLRNYLINLRRAAAEGFPVRGYFVWSLMDNFEWADGYSKRFGIYHVNFETQKRTPKLSADFYREVIRRNSVC